MPLAFLLPDFMKFTKNPLMKRVITLRYLRDELKHSKYLSPKGETRLKQLEMEIQHIEEQMAMQSLKELA